MIILEQSTNKINGCQILQHVGDLGNILADKNGRASFRLEDRHVKVVYYFCVSKQY